MELFFDFDFNFNLIMNKSNDNNKQNINDSNLSRDRESSILDINSFGLFEQTSAFSISMSSISVNNVNNSIYSWNHSNTDDNGFDSIAIDINLKTNLHSLSSQSKYTENIKYYLRKSVLSMIRKGDIMGIFQIAEFGVFLDNINGLYRVKY